MPAHQKPDRLPPKTPNDLQTGQPTPGFESMEQVRKRLRRQLNTKEAALAFLKEHGFLTPTGRLPKKYGG